MHQKLDKIEGVDISTAVPIEKLKSNIFDARKHLLAPISTCPDWREERAIALIGGGPSLSSQMELLKTYKTIMVCGSAHDYVIEQGIVPTYCIVCDPDPIMAKYLTKLNGYCTYLIASQCDDVVFNLMLSYKAYKWHASSGLDFDKEVFTDDVPRIIGGCTVGTRAIGVALAMGFNNIHLFGYDTCLTDDYKHHAYDFVEPEKESLGNITEIQLGSSDKKFKVAGYMLAQLFDFKHMLATYSDKLNIKVFGGGLLAHLMELGQAEALKQKESN